MQFVLQGLLEGEAVKGMIKAFYKAQNLFFVPHESTAPNMTTLIVVTKSYLEVEGKSSVEKNHKRLRLLTS